MGLTVTYSLKSIAVILYKHGSRLQHCWRCHCPSRSTNIRNRPAQLQTCIRREDSAFSQINSQTAYHSHGDGYAAHARG